MPSTNLIKNTRLKTSHVLSTPEEPSFFLDDVMLQQQAETPKGHRMGADQNQSQNTRS